MYEAITRTTYTVFLIYISPVSRAHVFIPRSICAQFHEQRRNEIKSFTTPGFVRILRWDSPAIFFVNGLETALRPFFRKGKKHRHFRRRRRREMARPFHLSSIVLRIKPDFSRSVRFLRSTCRRMSFRASPETSIS